MKPAFPNAITACSANYNFGFDPNPIQELRKSNIVQQDFAATMMSAMPGELVLADLPYLDSKVNGVMSFTACCGENKSPDNFGI